MWKLLHYTDSPTPVNVQLRNWSPYDLLGLVSTTMFVAGLVPCWPQMLTLTEIIHTNIVGPLPPSQGFIYMYLLAIIGCYTLWPEAIPLMVPSLRMWWLRVGSDWCAFDHWHQPWTSLNHNSGWNSHLHIHLCCQQRNTLLATILYSVDFNDARISSNFQSFIIWYVYFKYSMIKSSTLRKEFCWALCIYLTCIYS